MRFGAEGWTSSVPMDCQEKLATQAAATKAVDSGAKVFVYRNMVKALPCAPPRLAVCSCACRNLKRPRRVWVPARTLANPTAR